MLSKKFIPILFIVLWNFLYSTSGFAASISGVVVESKTQEPLAYVNIFLANTDQGCSSDLNGYFSIVGIEPDKYQLIASHIGYEIFKKWIDLKPGAKPFIEISLKQSPVAGDTVSVTARRKFSQGVDAGQILIGKHEMNIAPKLGEPDLFRVIETFPGVTTVNDFNMGLYIRGGNSDQNLILLDGMPIYNPFHLMGIFSTFDEEAIQWTNVSKSRIDPIYGNRLSSVIDINVRDGTAIEHEGYINLSFLSSKFRAEGPHPLGSYLVTIRRTYADLFINALNEIGILPPELRLPYYFVDGMGKVVIKPGNRQRLEITSYIGRDVYDMAVVDDDPESGKYTWQNSALGLNYSAILSPHVAFYLRTSASQFKSQWLPPDTTNAESIDNVFTGKMVNAYLKVENKLIGQIKAGGEFSYYQYHLRTKGFSYQQIYFEDNSHYENSVFVYLFKQFGALLCFNGGFRMTRFSLQDTMTFSPQLSCGARISPTQEINLHWGKYHQDLMTIGTEEVLLSMFDAWVTVPKSLPVMSAEHFALNYMWEIHPNIEFRAALFHKNFSNIVEYNTTKFSPIDPDFVSGTATADGLELFIKKVLGKMQGWVSYTYSLVRKKVNGIRYPPKYDKPHNLDLVINYRLSKKWSIGSRFVFNSGTPFTKIIGYTRQQFYDDFQIAGYPREVPIYGKRNVYRLPPYHRLDLNLIKKFEWKSRPMEFYVDFANVYGRLNVLAFSNENEAWIQMPPIVTVGIRGKLW